MSKELIEKLREDGKFLGGNFGKLMREAADALESKTAPVGEREAFEAHMRVGGYSNPDKHPDGSYVSSAMELWWQGWEARAAHQRQQAREVVMPPLIPSEPFTTIDRGSKNFKAGWNAYAQEFARLNKGAGSHE